MNKMNHPLRQLLLVFLLLGPWGELPGQSKAERSSSADKKKEEVTLDKHFKKRAVSEKDLKAFQARVEQKVRDLADYLQLVSDSSYALKTRERAASQAVKLFLGKEELLQGIPIDSGKSHQGAVRVLFDRLQSEEQPMIGTQVRQVKAGDFEKQKEGLYEGDLRFELVCSFRWSKDGGLFAKELVQMKGKSILKKVPKRFGKEEEMVWEVFLGSIRRSAP